MGILRHNPVYEDTVEFATANNPENSTPEPGNSALGCVNGCGIGCLSWAIVAVVVSTFVGSYYDWSVVWMGPVILLWLGFYVLLVFWWVGPLLVGIVLLIAVPIAGYEV